MIETNDKKGFKIMNKQHLFGVSFILLMFFDCSGEKKPLDYKVTINNVYHCSPGEFDFKPRSGYQIIGIDASFAGPLLEHLEFHIPGKDTGVNVLLDVAVLDHRGKLKIPDQIKNERRFFIIGDIPITAKKFRFSEWSDGPNDFKIISPWIAMENATTIPCVKFFRPYKDFRDYFRNRALQR